MDAVSNGRLQFGDYELDASAGQLFRDGRPVKIQPQPLRVLAVLLERPGEIVSREQLRARIWGEATFVEFDQGLNYAIRQIRLALRDEAAEPRYIETLPKQGYRLIAPVIAEAEPVVAAAPAAAAVSSAAPSAVPSALPPASAEPPQPVQPFPDPPSASRRGFWVPVFACLLLLLIGAVAYRVLRPRPQAVRYTQLTDFTDSAGAPALSPDGRMVAFIRGDADFMSADPIYVKLLPNGEARRISDDSRFKYGLAFSPDSSQVAYTVMDSRYFSTYAVSVLGGDSHLLLQNAAGLSWLGDNQLLYSEFRSGIHLGVVTSDPARNNLREIYWPPHERGMAHYTYPSTDRRWALVVEMNEIGYWGPCRLISLASPAAAAPRTIGPSGACRNAGWSPDGRWMYFTAVVEGRSHLWRQRFPDRSPEQLTFGAAEEQGIAVEPDGKSLITSIGVRQSSLWIHDAAGDHQLSSEGDVVTDSSAPQFSRDDKTLYYLIRHPAQGTGAELWRTNMETGKSEAVFPGVDMLAYDVSPDGRQVVYSIADEKGNKQIWVAAPDRSSPAVRVGNIAGNWPHFNAQGQILYERTEGASNYIDRVNLDGSNEVRIAPYSFSEIMNVSPGRHWLVAPVPVPPSGTGPVVMAISLDGGPPRRLCYSFCMPVWSSNGSYLFLPLEGPSTASPGHSMAIPLGPGEALPDLPAEGIPADGQTDLVRGAKSFPRGNFVPGNDFDHYAYINTTLHSNLYRVTLP